jgi:hypothetical protein
LAFNNVMAIPWSAGEGGESFQFELSVAPIDEAGNVGEAQRVLVQHDDGGGCTIQPGGGAGAGDPTARAVVIAIAVWIVMSARRRRTS